MSTRITSVAVTESTVDNTVIGGVTPLAGSFTTPSGGDNSTRAATTAWALLGFAISLGTNGYIKLPTWMSGLTIQWCQGANVTGDSIQTVSFPIAFSTACLAVFTTCFLNTSTNVIKGWGVLSSNTNGVSVELIRRGDEGSFSVTPLVLAIGH